MQHFFEAEGPIGHSSPMISIVIPTLNAAGSLPRCFDSLLDAAMSGILREVIIADGGSTDETCVIAEAAGARFVTSEKGRGSQLAAGAEAARSDWLLFLRADTALEKGWEAEAVAFMDAASVERPRAASFRFALDDFDPKARRTEILAALRCWTLALPYAGQGLLIPARLYRKLGGYRSMSSVEHVDFIRRLGRRRLVMLRSRAIIGRRRGSNESPLKHSVRNAGILFLYTLRVPTPVLARLCD